MLWQSIKHFAELKQQRRTDDAHFATALRKLRLGISTSLSDRSVGADYNSTARIPVHELPQPASDSESLAYIWRRTISDPARINELISQPETTILASRNTYVDQYNDDHVRDLIGLSGGGVDIWAWHFKTSEMAEASVIGHHRDQAEANADGEGIDLADHAEPAARQAPAVQPGVGIHPSTMVQLLGYNPKGNANKRGATLKSHLRLTVGCRVALTRNLATALGAVNGALGRVVGFRYYLDGGVVDPGLVTWHDQGGSCQFTSPHSHRARAAGCLPGTFFFTLSPKRGSHFPHGHSRQVW